MYILYLHINGNLRIEIYSGQGEDEELRSCHGGYYYSSRIVFVRVKSITIVVLDDDG